jgi:hypothetical protein
MDVYVTKVGVGLTVVYKNAPPRKTLWELLAREKDVIAPVEEYVITTRGNVSAS